MLTKKFLEHIAKLTATDIATIENAIKDANPVEIEINENITVLTPEQLTEIDNNMKEAGKKEGETIGKAIGKELAVKDIKAKLSITDPSKDPEHIAGIIQGQLKGDNALKEQVTLLQKDLSERTNEITSLKSQIEAVKADTEMLSLLPQGRITTLEDSEHLELVKKNLVFTQDGIQYKGEILRNPQTKAPLTKKEAIEHFYSTRPGLVADTSGAGGGGGTGGASGRGAGSSGGASGTFKTLKDVRKSWTSSNQDDNWGSDKSQEFLETVLKKNPDLIMEDDGKD